jgi:hypothetical protein
MASHGATLEMLKPLRRYSEENSCPCVPTNAEPVLREALEPENMETLLALLDRKSHPAHPASIGDIFRRLWPRPIEEGTGDITS